MKADEIEDEVERREVVGGAEEEKELIGEKKP